jgi:hypothetical protein
MKLDDFDFSWGPCAAAGRVHNALAAAFGRPANGCPRC